MGTFKALVVLLMAWVASWSEGSAGQYHWDNNAGTMPHEMNPPWTLISEGNVYAYLAPDAGPTTGHLPSTQAVDNVHFEQRGSSLQMTQPLVIQAVLRLVSGPSTSEKSGPVGFAFTVFVDNTAVLQGELHESQGNFGSEPRIPGTNAVHDGDATILVRGSCGPCRSSTPIPARSPRHNVPGGYAISGPSKRACTDPSLPIRKPAMRLSSMWIPSSMRIGSFRGAGMWMVSGAASRLERRAGIRRSTSFAEVRQSSLPG